MMRYISEILAAKEKYFRRGVDEKTLTKIIKEIRKKIEMDENRHSLSDGKFYRLTLILLIEKFKSLLEFERELVFAFESEYTILYIKTKKTTEEITRIDLTHSENIEKPRKVKRQNFSKKVSRVLTNWLEKNILHPYPSRLEKKILSSETGLKLFQISTWFVNARKRMLPLIVKNANNSD